MKAKDKLLDSLKKAMQGEQDSVSIYKGAAEKSKNLEVKEFFIDRMKEEQLHFNTLLDHYNSLEKDEPLPEISPELNLDKIENTIFSPDFIKRIGENQELFSAISTALLLEKNAIDHYASLAKSAEHPALKSFFDVMVSWEKNHYEDLVSIQKEAETYYWQINDFVPF